ncbi:TBPIP-domain-containing protein [Dentipellis sp. KUC8613]|nr:TBPIP-domain-containing protein [Dentipellis sp. KUC8613]
MSKAKSDVKVLKGQEAEDRVYAYIKRMNRPFGAVDVSANLKGAVPKTATQKILLALAEKGQVTQKTYGKTTFFVANQSTVDTMPDGKISELEAEAKTLDEGNKALAAEIKAAAAELSKLKSTPTDAELAAQMDETSEKAEQLRKHLEPLRSGTPLVDAEALAALDQEWTKWRAEWVRRKKVFLTFWALVSDTLSPQDATELRDDLGIEYDSVEHTMLEQGPLCSINLGRKR